MENTNNTLDSGLLQNNTISLAHVARSIKVAAILCTIWIGILCLVGTIGIFRTINYNFATVLNIALSLISLTTTALFILPIIMVFKFSNQTNQAIISNNQTYLNNGLSSLKKAAQIASNFKVIKLVLISLKNLLYFLL